MNYFGLLEFTIKPEYLGEPNFKKLVNDFKQNVNERDSRRLSQIFNSIRRLLDINKPSLFNLEYLFNYQIGSMYFRYLMWNLVTNDVKWKTIC